VENDNRILFDQAIRTAEILHKMFGANCEVVVHDFSNLEESLIHVSGTITNRKIGSPATDLILKEFKKKDSDIKDIPNYSTTSKNGVTMKSSTVFIRDFQDKVIGALCINFNISFLSQVSKDLHDFLEFEETHAATENFYTTVHDVIEEMIKQVIQEFNKPPLLLELDEKVEVVRRLEEKGAFLIKGATEYLAAVMGVSKFTVYNYLQKIRAQNEYHMREVRS
jgi:predicted transcriptional regulator YheO